MSSGIRVAQLVHSLCPGGTEKLVIHLAGCAAAEFDSRVYCVDEAGDWASPLRAHGVPVEVLGRRPGFDVRLIGRLRALLRRDRVDVLHCHQYTPFVYGGLAAFSARRVRVVYTEHGRLSDGPPSSRRRTANLVLGRLASRMCAVSADLRRFMIDEGLPARQIEVIRNGIEPGPPPSLDDRRRARAELDLPETLFVAGTAARLDPVKDLGVALRAFAEATRDARSGCFVVIGDGPERQRLEHVARECGVHDRARFLGQRSDVRALLPAFDVYVNTSITEGISITILEAMAAGVPVVATSVGGTPEIVSDGVTGLLAPPRDAASLALHLRRLMAEPAGRAILAAAARDRMLRDFTAARMAREYLTMYRELGRPAVPASASRHGGSEGKRAHAPNGSAA